MNDVWEELDALCRELEASAGPASESRAHLRTQLEALRPGLELLDRHYQELGAEEAMAQVRERLLAGAGVIQRIVFDYGLERLLALMWPAAADPRAELAEARGEYRVEVWLRMGEDGRPRVRVVGEKRLEAPLPVAREKFRGVLLGAVRAPAFIAHPAAGEQPADAAAEAPPAEPAAAPEAEPARPAAGAEAPWAQAAAESEAPPATEEARPAPPAADEPIPMGPATPVSAAETPPPPAGDGPRMEAPSVAWDEATAHSSGDAEEPPVA